VVTRYRYEGFVQAHREQGVRIDENLLFANAESRAQVDHAVETALEKGADCILCIDDGVCIRVLRKLRKMRVRVPEDIWVASFYDSEILATNIPAITALSFDTRELGREACKTLLVRLSGENAPEKTLLPYGVVLKDSTK
jgi:DNA-binding LacI/PurR family transcriptional regulator